VKKFKTKSCVATIKEGTRIVKEFVYGGNEWK
jgi:hypothetical protein